MVPIFYSIASLDSCLGAGGDCFVAGELSFILQILFMKQKNRIRDKNVKKMPIFVGLGMDLRDFQYTSKHNIF